MTLVGLVSLADWYPLDDDSHECSCEQVFVCGYRRTAEINPSTNHRRRATGAQRAVLSPGRGRSPRATASGGHLRRAARPPARRSGHRPTPAWST